MISLPIIEQGRSRPAPMDTAIANVQIRTLKNSQFNPEIREIGRDGLTKFCKPEDPLRHL